MLPATPPSSQGQQLPEEAGNQDRPPGRYPLPASLLYTFQICTWLHVRACWHHSDPQHSPACTRAEASGTSHDFLPCSHIRPNKSYPNCIWKNNWDEIADNHKGVFQVLRTSQSGFLWLQQIQSKQRSPHDWHWGKTSDLLSMISHSADFTWGSSASCRGRQLLQWWQPCVTQILKSASHNQ